MATTKRQRRHARERGLLSSAEELNLLIGGPSPFPSEQARREAWMTHREALLASDKDGRPHAWVCYEGGGFLPSEGGRISLALVRLGIWKPGHGLRVTTHG